MKSSACFRITLMASKMLLLRTPWGWGPTSKPAVKKSEETGCCCCRRALRWTSFGGRIFRPLPPEAAGARARETHRRGAWRRSAKWNISKEDVHSAERDNWLERWLSATRSQQKRDLSSRYLKRNLKRNTESHGGIHVRNLSEAQTNGSYKASSSTASLFCTSSRWSRHNMHNNQHQHPRAQICVKVKVQLSVDGRDWFGSIVIIINSVIWLK